MWFGVNGWGWCGLIVNMQAMAVFWGAVFTAILLAVHLLIRGRSNPSATTVSKFRPGRRRSGRTVSTR